MVKAAFEDYGREVECCAEDERVDDVLKEWGRGVCEREEGVESAAESNDD